MKKKPQIKPALKIAAPAAPPLWPLLWPYLALAALAFAIYANALGNGFVSDDNFQLLGNPLVTDWHKIPSIFQHHIWAFAGQETTNYYRPIQMVVYMVMYYVFGFDAFSFHLLMLLIHIVNTLLVYRLGRRLLSTRDAALVAGLLFAVHPIHDEAVVWIAVLPDVLLTTIVLISLLLFIRQNGSPRGWQIAGHCGLFFLALLTKEPGAMLLPLLAAYEWFFLGRGFREMLRNVWLYVAMAATFGLYCPVRIHALGAMAPAQGFYYKLPLKELALSVVVILGQYLGKLVLPLNLCYYYLFEPTKSVNFEVIAAVVGILVVIAGMILLRRRAPLASFGLAAILIPLAPVLNITGVGENAFTERYLYLPSVGLVLAVALGWEWIAARQKPAAWIAIGVIVAAAGTEVILHNPVWHDDVELFTYTFQQSPKSGTLIGNLGWFHYQRGEFDEAIDKYLIALKLQPDTALFHNNIGNAYAQKGRPADAEVEIRKAIALKPDYAEAYMNLGLVLEAEGRIPEAEAEHKKALQLKPNYAEALTALALLRMKVKDYDTAIGLLKHAIESRPNYTEAYINLGVVYNDTHRWREGAEVFKQAVDVGGGYAQLYVAHYNLGIAYASMNSPQAAIAEFQKTLQMKPDFKAAQDAIENVKKMKSAPDGIAPNVR